MLADGDTIWDKLYGARPGGSQQKKYVEQMHAQIDKMQGNLQQQSGSLDDLESKLAKVENSTKLYRSNMQSSKEEHKNVQVALESRVKTLTKMMKQMSSEPKRKNSGDKRKKKT